MRGVDININKNRRMNQDREKRHRTDIFFYNHFHLFFNFFGMESEFMYIG